jgi:hypothetical protein
VSIRAVAWVFDFSESTLADRLVLLAIANHCDARGYNSYPSIEHIAREARVSRATIFRSIETLEQMGELVVHRRPGRSSIYGLPALLDPSQPATGQGSQIETGGVSNTRHRGPNLRPKPLVTVKETCAEPVAYDPGTLEKDAEGRWFVRTSTPAPKPITQTTMPPELPEETRARGAEWARALRRGGDPA